MGFNLLEEIEGFEKVVIVDAVDMGKEPGHIASFKAEQVLSLPSGKTFSLHELGLSEVLQIGAQLGYDLSRTTIVGIQPQDMSRGDGLTDSVQGRFPDLVEKVLAEINN
jgi:hydrogenase maturation protease